MFDVKHLKLLNVIARPMVSVDFPVSRPKKNDWKANWKDKGTRTLIKFISVGCAKFRHQVFKILFILIISFHFTYFSI